MGVWVVPAAARPALAREEQPPGPPAWEAGLRRRSQGGLAHTQPNATGDSVLIQEFQKFEIRSSKSETNGEIKENKENTGENRETKKTRWTTGMCDPDTPCAREAGRQRKEGPGAGV